MSYAKRIDANQPFIVDALRAAGAFVEPNLAKLGKGAPDLLWVWQGRLGLAELKDGSKPPSARKLTPDEVRWHERIALAGYRVPIWNSLEDAFETLKIS